MRRVALIVAAGLAAAIALVGCAPASPFPPGIATVGDSDPAAEPTPPAETTQPDDEPGAADPEAFETPASSFDGSFAFGTGPIEIDIWVDFLCPHCKAFEDTNGARIDELLAADAAMLRVHPISILNRSSMGTGYSTRSAGAFACVAELAPESALDYFRDLFWLQPSNGVGWLTDAEFADLAVPAAKDCILEQRYAAWVDHWTQQALSWGLRGTPATFVNGVEFPGAPTDGTAFDEFIISITGP